MAIELRPPLNLSGHSMIMFSDGTSMSTDTAASLGSLTGQLNANQMPTTLAAGTSLTLLDVGTF